MAYFVYVDSLECFATDIQDNIDVVTILPNLISYGLLTTKQQSDLTYSHYSPFEKQQILREIILQLNEKCVKKFLQCLSETSSYDPHKQLLDKIRCEHLLLYVQKFSQNKFGIKSPQII